MEVETAIVRICFSCFVVGVAMFVEFLTDAAFVLNDCLPPYDAEYLFLAVGVFEKIVVVFPS